MLMTYRRRQFTYNASSYDDEGSMERTSEQESDEIEKEERKVASSAARGKKRKRNMLKTNRIRHSS